METVTLSDQVRAVRRELRLRETVYPGLVAKGRMSQALAADEIERMKAVLTTLEGLANGPQPHPGREDHT